MISTAKPFKLKLMVYWEERSENGVKHKHSNIRKETELSVGFQAKATDDRS